MSRKFKVYAALIAFAHVVSGCSDNQEAETRKPEKVATPERPSGTDALAAGEKLVLAFGDSLYAGYGVPQNESFPHELEDVLEERGVDVRIYNGGVSGDTTAAGRQRLSFTLDGLPRKPDLVMVGLGGNDMLRGLPPEQTRDNLQAILDELKQRDIPVMLTGMVAAPNLGASYVDKFNAIYPALARQYDAPLYPFFLDGVVTEAGLMLQDGIHPNEQGIDRIVDRVAPMVADALTKPAA